MKRGMFLSWLAVLMLSLVSADAHGSVTLSCEATLKPVLAYQQTAKAIISAMEGGTTAVRKESYDYVRIDNCVLEYKVNGIYPSGLPYSIKFSDMDFSQLNLKESRPGNDYAAFVMLNFNSPAQYNNGKILPIHTVMVIASDYDRAQTLFGLFSHLGELCRPKN